MKPNPDLPTHFAGPKMLGMDVVGASISSHFGAAVSASHCNHSHFGVRSNV